MDEKKLAVINGEMLMDMDLPPTEFIVDGLLPQGLHILAGAPKTGKSWLLLDLCLRVASGNNFWNLRTKKGTALYLCLEDSMNRIQDRLAELTENAPPEVFFAITANSLADGLTKQIEQFITEHIDTKLVVIDTLQKIRAAAVESGTYAADYNDIGILKSLADKYGICIIAVQHLRKQRDADPHAMVSGSTGLLGAADGSYVLKRDKVGEETAKLYVRGRDIEERILTLRFDSELKEWLCISYDTPQTDSLMSDSILSLLIDYLKREREFVGTASELANKLGADVKSNALSRRLRQHERELAEIGIEYVKSRSGERRELLLIYTPKEPMTI